MNKVYPKITIITPSYNQGQFLERTIRSVLDQNYPNLEFIIIDGGSTDNSVEIIKKYQDRLTYWVSEKDKGTYEANNKGLAKVTGDYWCVVNSDDVLLPNSINTVVGTLKEKPEQKWFVGGIHYIDENDIVTGRQFPKKPDAIAGYTFLKGCWISHPTVFLHRDLIQEIGLFDKRHLMDWNYWLRLEYAGYKPYIIESFLAGLRMHSDCKSADRIKLQEEFLLVFNSFIIEHKINNLPAIRTLKKKYTFVLYRLNLSNSIIRGDRSRSLKYLFKTIWLMPKSLFTRWYNGAIKRFFFGVKPNDPLFNEVFIEESNSNWNNLNN